ncbi:MAG: hypothetical protein BYD32DRAFT_402585 [Podila humilis]|nr:MAG: hypothetical protein BYD32DRAFT_402585 [Podila humilis]
MSDGLLTHTVDKDTHCTTQQCLLPPTHISHTHNNTLIKRNFHPSFFFWLTLGSGPLTSHTSTIFFLLRSALGPLCDALFSPIYYLCARFIHVHVCMCVCVCVLTQMNQHFFSVWSWRATA